MNEYERYLQEKNWGPEYRYMLLYRMYIDCGCLLAHLAYHLWAGNVVDQIGYMKALWESFPEAEKPEWLTMEEIIEYEQKMTKSING